MLKTIEIELLIKNMKSVNKNSIVNKAGSDSKVGEIRFKVKF